MIDARRLALSHFGALWLHFKHFPSTIFFLAVSKIFFFLHLKKSCSNFFRTNLTPEFKKISLHLKSLIFFFQSSSTLSLVLPRLAFKKPIFWSTSRVNELAIFWTWFGIGQRHPTDQQQSHSWDFSLKMCWGHGYGLSHRGSVINDGIFRTLLTKNSQIRHRHQNLSPFTLVNITFLVTCND